MERKRIKVVWICHLANSEVRSHFIAKVPFLERMVRKLFHDPDSENTDFAIWNTNGIKEFEQFTDEVELHIVAPCHYLIPESVRFEIRGVHYYFFKDRPQYLYLEIRKRLFGKYPYWYKRNRRRIKEEVESIAPDIVHVIGAENPYYSLAALDIPMEVPVIVQLQTLLSEPGFKDRYFMRAGDYEFRQRVEESVLIRCPYIGSSMASFVEPVLKINPKAVILPISLALSEPISQRDNNFQYDFVYFASNIDKAADWALEAFAIASRKHPGITLDIVGGGSPGCFSALAARIEELGLGEYVRFEGRLATHDDVMRQIRLARFALLPLKVDRLSGTIRESMANGIPVITTVTPDTPDLNSKRECVMLSEPGDHEGLAENMCRLLEDDKLAEMLSQNSLLTANERQSNREIMREWLEAYYRILDERR